VLWPDDAPDFAEQVWCVEVELTAKTAQGTAPIVSKLFGRTRDYGGGATAGPALVCCRRAVLVNRRRQTSVSLQTP
jgi:hypothetical protein